MPSEPARTLIARLAAVAVGGILTLDAAASTLKADRRVASRRLADLVEAGWLSRVRRGVFVVRPLEAMPGVVLAEEDPWTVAARVFAPCYIGGWTAAGHWELTEQLFRATFVVTSQHVRHADSTVGSSAFRLAHGTAAPSALTPVWRGGMPVSVSSVERTIADACNNPTWVGGGRHFIDIFCAAVADDRMTPKKLLAELRHDATGAALGRVGLLVERYWPDATNVLRYAQTHRGTGYIRFDPAVRTPGRLVSRWGVWVNVTFPERVA